MRNLWIFAGCLLAVSPIARADEGIVTQVHPDRVVVQMSHHSVRLGEKVELTVFPLRYDGIGAGIVTDIDARSHAVAVVLIPKKELPHGGTRKSSEPSAEQTRSERRSAPGFRLFSGDVLIVTETGHFASAYPHYQVAHPRADQRSLEYDDIDMPIFAPATLGPVDRTSTPHGPSNRSLPAGPDIETLLRSLSTGVTPTASDNTR